jgi:hypothetical protein
MRAGTMRHSLSAHFQWGQPGSNRVRQQRKGETVLCVCGCFVCWVWDSALSIELEAERFEKINMGGFVM